MAKLPIGGKGPQDSNSQDGPLTRTVGSWLHSFTQETSIFPPI